ncbi:MAG: hypothetical protein HUU38_06360 [Anaerolineales bacterium]|jgi:hypothetical protein|nr:hypothetical protein [Anaerolineales bacterium]
MFLKILFSFRRQHWMFGGFGLILCLLGACNTTQGPLKITDISVNPDPVIGKTATLHVDIMSSYDEPSTTLLIGLPPGVKLMKGDLTWEGSLTANQPQSHEIAICVLYEGDWPVSMTASSLGVEGERPGNFAIEILHIITTTDSVRVVLGKDYRIVQPPGGMEAFPTPLPETPPTDICQ